MDPDLPGNLMKQTNPKKNMFNGPSLQIRTALKTVPSAVSHQARHPRVEDPLLKRKNMG